MLTGWLLFVWKTQQYWLHSMWWFDSYTNCVLLRLYCLHHTTVSLTLVMMMLWCCDAVCAVYTVCYHNTRIISGNGMNIAIFFFLIFPMHTNANWSLEDNRVVKETKKKIRYGCHYANSKWCEIKTIMEYGLLKYVCTIAESSKPQK